MKLPDETFCVRRTVSVSKTEISRSTGNEKRASHGHKMYRQAGKMTNDKNETTIKGYETR